MASFRHSFANAGAGRVGAVRLCASVALPLIVVAGVAAWLMLPEPSDAGGKDDWPAYSSLVLPTQNVSTQTQSDQGTLKDVPSPPVAAAPATEPATVGVATPPQATLEAEPKPTEPTTEKSPLDGLRISSQFFQRGGLGSKALVTLTLRNRNDFAVKDVEIDCDFIRDDGSHVTDLRRAIPGIIAMKSRKTYPHMLIGFVNINASKAKCAVVTASRL
ncbi:hypothetical protein AS156_27670 [Bradyrhizobium macuxiense]|uniref:Uncharacterized protein n=1 Tax=Bradyrhizobium macuxiense TaxID=1755647 RepID=A0A109K510_9BRAD|nr:hypothetical protein AS156_27670 [Bradyrhizobium macuxiense]